MNKEYEGRKVDVLGKGELNCICPFIYIYIYFSSFTGLSFDNLPSLPTAHIPRASVQSSGDTHPLSV